MNRIRGVVERMFSLKNRSSSSPYQTLASQEWFDSSDLAISFDDDDPAAAGDPALTDAGRKRLPVLPLRGTIV
ncbi:MAG: hypothetical protein OEM96_08790, partial [Gemmatimonadota bacterium]|nr:hypothetical protein [Gemmatimonadota bacterium]